jgi:hypothetical protein
VGSRAVLAAVVRRKIPRDTDDKAVFKFLEAVDIA